MVVIVVLLLVFAVLRVAVVPRSFGQYGTIGATRFRITVAALAVVALVSLSSGWIALSVSSIAMTRTLALCAMALVFAFAASGFKRPKLGWPAYATIGFGTVTSVRRPAPG